MHAWEIPEASEYLPKLNVLPENQVNVNAAVARTGISMEILNDATNNGTFYCIPMRAHKKRECCEILL